MVQRSPIIEPPINEITRRIVEVFDPERVVIFGSRARGDHRPDSDVDVFVEMETKLKMYDRMRAVYDAFGLHPWAMDVIVYTPAEVQEQRRYRNSILRTIEAEGKIVYEKSTRHGDTTMGIGEVA